MTITRTAPLAVPPAAIPAPRGHTDPCVATIGPSVSGRSGSRGQLHGNGDHPASAGSAPRRPARRRLRRLSLVLACCALLWLLLADSATAKTVLAQPASIDAVLTNIRNWIMGILALLATVFLTIGGVRYVTAAGDPGEVEAAKRAFKSAGFGYALAALAPLLVQILRGIVGA